jgi:hypothetical protein
MTYVGQEVRCHIHMGEPDVFGCVRQLLFPTHCDSWGVYLLIHSVYHNPTLPVQLSYYLNAKYPDV